MKKLINNPLTVTADLVGATAAIDRDIAIVPEYHVLARADYAEHAATGKVALISGGGSGHEPAHAGYIGAGMLTAAVAGEVFTSPSVDAVLAAIRLVTGPAGCLLIVKNYTGDRLNFGLAAAIARSEGYRVDLVLVDDDVAIPAGKSRAGARGLAGTVLVHKVAGAAAEAGDALDLIKADVESFIAGIGTMSVGLTSCIVPAAGKPGFALGQTEIEYGLGIHGEPGVNRGPMEPVDTIVERLVQTIVERKPALAGTAVLLVNGLGGTPPAEIAIAAGSALRACRARGLQIKRVAIGSLLTALEMAGCSISIAAASTALLERLDAPTSAAAWPPLLTPGEHAKHLAAPNAPQARAAGIGPAIDSEGQARLRRAISAAATALLEEEEALTLLDSMVGDGDLGISLARGAGAVLDELDMLDLEHPAHALDRISATLRRTLGGTSGPLYAAFTLAVAVSLRDEMGPIGLSHWSDAFQAGCRAIAELGGARQGDRTMVDALLPAAAALAGAPDARRALAAGAAAAAQGADQTAGLDPRLGRSSYVGSRALGHIDPGAKAVAVWLAAIARTF
jgi:dihydroxyacetone kinase